MSEIENAITDFEHSNNNLIGCLGSAAENEPEFINRKIALEALEKQIPRSPVEQQINPRGELIGLCPNCKEWWINKYYHFCPNCGQKLDWSERNG